MNELLCVQVGTLLVIRFGSALDLMTEQGPIIGRSGVCSSLRLTLDPCKLSALLSGSRKLDRTLSFTEPSTSEGDPWA